MNPIQPPRIAAWLLRHLGCSPNNDVVIGDLNERYRQGRSRLWYWRQTAAAIVLSFFKEVSSHKLLTLWAMYIGWGIYWISRYGLILTRELVLGRRFWTYSPVWIWMTVQTAETVISGIVAGWFVARLCRQSRRVMVLAFALTWECVPFVLLLQTMLTEQFRPFNPLVFFTLPIIFTLTAIGALLGGGVFNDPRNNEGSGHHSAAVS